MATSMPKMENAESSDAYDEKPNLCQPCSFKGLKANAKLSDTNDKNPHPCQPCAFEDNTVNSESFCMDCQEYLCAKCSTYHNALKATRKHKLVSRDDAQESSYVVVKDKCSAKCTVHQDKTVKYFCKTHNYLGCSVCMTVNHKQCTDVEYIPTLAEDIQNNDSLKKFYEQLKAIEAACKAGLSDAQKILKVTKTGPDRLKKAMQDFRKKVVSDFDKMEKELMLEAVAITDIDKQKLDDLNEKLSKHQSEADATIKQVRTLLHSGRNCDTFYLMKKETERLMSLNCELIETLCGQTYQRYWFQPSNVGTRMGRLVCKQEGSCYDSVVSVLYQNIDGPQIAQLLKPGTRVCRGKDWKWGNEDNCGLGTIIGQDFWTEGQFQVKWDSEFIGQHSYRMGAQGAYDLQIVWWQAGGQQTFSRVAVEATLNVYK